MTLVYGVENTTLTTLTFFVFNPSY